MIDSVHYMTVTPLQFSLQNQSGGEGGAYWSVQSGYQNIRPYTQCCGAVMSAFWARGAPGPQHIHFPRPRAEVRPEHVYIRQ